MQIEHPQGIPISKGINSFTPVFNGKVLLSYDPPMIFKGELSITVVGKIPHTNIMFSGPMDANFAGDIFMPSDTLVQSVRNKVQEIATDINETSLQVQTAVLEEILNYCIVNVPVKALYERIRNDYPNEYRRLNLDYRRRNDVSIEEDLSYLQSVQQNARFARLKSFIKTAFKDKDVVTIDDDKLERLRDNVRTRPQYDLIKKELEKIKSFDGKYIVYKDPDKENKVRLLGKNPRSGKMAYTDTGILQDFLQPWEQEAEEDPTSFMTSDEKQFYGVGEEGEAADAVLNDKTKATKALTMAKQKLKSKQSFAEDEMPYVFEYFRSGSIDDIGIRQLVGANPSYETILKYYNTKVKIGNKINSTDTGLISLKAEKGIPLTMKDAYYIAAHSTLVGHILGNKAYDIIGKNIKTISPALQKVKQNGVPVDPKFENTVKRMTQSRDFQKQENKPAIKQVKLENWRIPSSVYSDKGAAQKYAKQILQLYNALVQQKAEIQDQQFLSLVKSLQQ